MKKVKSYKPSKFKGKKFEGNKRNQSESLYTKKWSIYRFRFLHHNKFCYVCNRKSTVVDHIVPHKGDKELFWKVDNYIPLCKGCHDTITGFFDRHSTPRTEEKLDWLQKRRELNGTKVKSKIVPFKGENL